MIPLVFAAVTAVWAAVFSCHALAFRAGSPMLGLVPPAALVVFAITSSAVVSLQTRPAFVLVWLLSVYVAIGLVESLLALGKRPRPATEERPSLPPVP